MRITTTHDIVIYHLDDGEWTLATLQREDREYGYLVIDMTQPQTQSYIDKPNWFAEDYVLSHYGQVPDCASKGTAPGEYEHVIDFIRRTTPLLQIKP